MDFDAILNHIGQCGKWQWRNFFLLWLTREGSVETIHFRLTISWGDFL